MLLPLILQLYFKNIFISSLKKQQQKTTHVCILHIDIGQVIQTYFPHAK